MLASLFNTPLGVVVDDGFDGELFEFGFLSSYVLILDIGVLVGAAGVAVTSRYRRVPGWAKRLG